MLTKNQITETVVTFLNHRLSEDPANRRYLLDPVRLGAFVHVAYDKIQELEKLGHVPSYDHAVRYIQDQTEKWGNRKVNQALAHQLQMKQAKAVPQKV